MGKLVRIYALINKSLKIISQMRIIENIYMRTLCQTGSLFSARFTLNMLSLSTWNHLWQVILIDNQINLIRFIIKLREQKTKTL